MDNQVYPEEQTVKLDEGRAGSDPGKTLESRTLPGDDKMDEDQAVSDPGKSHLALAGPNPELMHDDFVATVYPKVHESFKFLADEHVILEDPPSSSGTLFSMKILDDTYTFGDQFFNDKSTEDEPGKQNVNAEVLSMANKEEFIAKKDMSRKRCRDDQDPPPPPLDSDLSKKKIHDFDTSRSKQPPTPYQAYKDPQENKLLSKTGDIGSFIKWFCKMIGKKKLSKSDLEVPTFNVGHRLVPDVSKPLPLRGPPARTSAMSISKVKAANNPNFRLKELIPSLWIESECDYNINAAYGITQWWFKQKDFYITRHNTQSDCRVVRSHLWILSVISIKTFDRYDYAFLREIVIRRADYNEDRNDQKKMMMENEAHKFTDGTIWFEDDKRRSELFMEVIERKLKKQRIFQSLEIFLGGRLRDVDYKAHNRTE
nr:hypothetical protein [Tanacetum cinerariifolium]